MSKFIVEKDNFVNGFIKPLSVFDSQDKCCYFFKEDNDLRGITYSSDRSVILDATLLNVEGDNFTPVVLRDLNRFIAAIGFCEDPKMSFEIDNNNLLHSSNHLKFKTYFLDPKFFDSKIPIKLSKIKELPKDSTFSMKPSGIANIKKSKNFARTTDKIYLSNKESEVFVTRDDKEKSNLDTISFILSNDFSGEDIKDIPLHISFFDLLQEKVDSIFVSINKEYGILQFLIENTKYKLHYITSALRK